jgi:hypothetical protein
MLQQLETPFKVLSVESKNGMVLILRMKIVFDLVDDGHGVQRLKPRERVYETLTRKLENLTEFLDE